MSKWPPVPVEGTFPHAKASRFPLRSSTTPALAALIKQAPGPCTKKIEDKSGLHGYT